MPDEVCTLGNQTLGLKTYISADCGEPRPEFRCKKYTCCDACYLDSQREQELEVGEYEVESDDEVESDYAVESDDDEDADSGWPGWPFWNMRPGSDLASYWPSAK